MESVEPTTYLSLKLRTSDFLFTAVLRHECTLPNRFPLSLSLSPPLSIYLSLCARTKRTRTRWTLPHKMQRLLLRYYGYRMSFWYLWRFYVFSLSLSASLSLSFFICFLSLSIMAGTRWKNRVLVHNAEAQAAVPPTSGR